MKVNNGKQSESMEKQSNQKVMNLLQRKAVSVLIKLHLAFKIVKQVLIKQQSMFDKMKKI